MDTHGPRNMGVQNFPEISDSTPFRISPEALPRNHFLEITLTSPLRRGDPTQLRTSTGYGILDTHNLPNMAVLYSSRLDNPVWRAWSNLRRPCYDLSLAAIRPPRGPVRR